MHSPWTDISEGKGLGRGPEQGGEDPSGKKENICNTFNKKVNKIK